MSSHSSDPDHEVWDATGKTPEKIAAWCAEYERGNRREMTRHRGGGTAGIHIMRAQNLACTDGLLAAIRAMAARRASGAKAMHLA
jgi:hypothetical protein